jgi:hypothetical protein
MSNNLTVNPVVVNTAMGSTFQASLPAINQRPYVLVEKVLWETPASIGDTVSIVDSQGNVLLPLTCEVASQSQIVDWSAHPKIWRDFQVTVLGSGTLYVYLR